MRSNPLDNLESVHGSLFDPWSLPAVGWQLLVTYDTGTGWWYRERWDVVQSLAGLLWRSAGQGRTNVRWAVQHGLPDIRRIDVGQFISEAIRRSVESEGEIEAHDEDVTARWPCLFDFVACSVPIEGEKGKKHKRITATITVFAAGGKWKVHLNDRESKRSHWGEGKSVLDALDDLERATRAFLGL